MNQNVCPKQHISCRENEKGLLMSNQKQHNYSFETEFKAFMELEADVAQLYHILGENTGEFLEFWEALREEERNHIRILNDLYKQVLNGTLVLRKELFQIEAINHSREFVQEKIRFSKNRQLPIEKALQIASAVENHAIDALVLQIFEESDDEQVKESFSRLVEESENHHQAIDEMIKMVKSRKEPGVLQKIINKLQILESWDE